MKKENKGRWGSYTKSIEEVSNANKHLIEKLLPYELVEFMNTPKERDIFTTNLKGSIDVLKGIKNKTQEQKQILEQNINRVILGCEYALFNKLKEVFFKKYLDYPLSLSFLKWEELTNKEKVELEMVKTKFRKEINKKDKKKKEVKNNGKRRKSNLD